MDHQQKLVDEFNKAHENIEVTLEAYGSNYDTKISAGMGSSDAPDIMYMWNYPAYADGLEPLESYIEKKVGLSLRKNSAIRCGTIILLKKKFMECRLDLLLMYCITIKIYLQRRGWKSRRMNGYGLICRMLQKQSQKKQMQRDLHFR